MRSLGVLLLILVTTVTAQDDSSCIDGDVDLMQDEGRSEIIGYVRYCWEGQWRSVCRQQDFNWNDNEARVACRQLGYQGDRYGSECPSEVEANTINETFIVTLCTAALNGTESSLQDCEISTASSCSCQDIARLQCTLGCRDGDIRLVGGASEREGRVEVCVDGRWGTVQTNNPRQAAEDICDSISLSSKSFKTCLGNRFGYRQSKPVCREAAVEYMRQTGCLEVNCSNATLEDSDDHETDLGVVCTETEFINNDNDFCERNGSFRLVGGSSYQEGRVEVCVDGRWGEVCYHEDIAPTICYQLGFPAQEKMISQSTMFGLKTYDCSVKSDPSNIICEVSACYYGLELGCFSYREISAHNNQICNEEIAATCNYTGQFRLTGGRSHNSGRLEVCEEGQWRAVCDLTDTPLTQICSQLGYAGNGTIVSTRTALSSEILYCCDNPNVNCSPCNTVCTKAIELECQPTSVTDSQCLSPVPTSSKGPTSMMEGTMKMPQPNQSSQSQNAVIGILVVALLATAAGWVVTCVVVQREWRIIKQSSPRGGTEIENKICYSHQLRMQDNELYEAVAQPLSERNPPQEQASPASPNYDIAVINQDSVYDRLPPIQPTPNNYATPTNYVTVSINEAALDTYDVIKPVESPAPVVDSNTAVREEVTDQFHDAEQHVYAVVNKKDKNADDGKTDTETAEEEMDSETDESSDSN